MLWLVTERKGGRFLLLHFAYVDIVERKEQSYMKVLKIPFFNSNLLSSVLCMSGLSPLEGFLFRLLFTL
jgi:hypothetical protein